MTYAADELIVAIFCDWSIFAVLADALPDALSGALYGALYGALSGAA